MLIVDDIRFMLNLSEEDISNEDIQRLKNYYKNDVILLQFSTLYLSLKIFNEISEKVLKEKEDTMKGLLNQILNMIENIKVEGQKKFYEIFAKQIHNWYGF